MFSFLAGVFTSAATVIGGALASLVAVLAGFLLARRMADFVLSCDIRLPEVVRHALETLARPIGPDAEYGLAQCEPFAYVLAIIAMILLPWLGIFCFSASFVVTILLVLGNAAMVLYFPHADPAVKMAVFEFLVRLGLIVTAEATDEALGNKRNRYSRRRDRALVLFGSSR